MYNKAYSNQQNQMNQQIISNFFLNQASNTKTENDTYIQVNILKEKLDVKNRHRKSTILDRTVIHFNSASIILDFKMESLNLIKKFSCEICDKNFLTNNYKALHISTVHEGQKNFKCVSCGKSITQLVHLKNHKCDSCEKFFTTSGSLKTHTKTIHEGQKF